tara:strand:- start:255792 stop:256559 length:768 start_codon:yes stop_codon:yes gene_type:complete
MSNVLTAFNTIVIKEMSRVIRIWPQSLLPPVITMTLYFVIFGTFIGSRVGMLDGVPYILYITPGLIMMSVINNAYTNVSSSFYGAKFARNIDEILVAPVPEYVILWGYVGAGMLRGLLTGILVLIVATFFTHISIQHLPLMLLVIILSSALFSIAGLINGLIANKFDDVMIVPTFVIMPLTYIGGIFYSINQLPPFWRDISKANPILYLINAFRYSMIGSADVPVWIAMTMIAFFLILFYTVAITMLKRGYGLRS